MRLRDPLHSSLTPELTLPADCSINQTFYFDVHPPLAKMLVGLAGFLSGFDGKFDFPSGAVYPDELPYTSMRVLLALPGIALVPLAWGTALELGLSGYGRHIVTLMVLTGPSRSSIIHSSLCS